MKTLNKVLVKLGAFLIVAAGVVANSVPVLAANNNNNTNTTNTGSGAVSQYLTEKNMKAAGFNAKEQTDFGKLVGNIINIALGLIGILSVAMIVYGGFQYTTSAGDSGKVTKAKNTILYGVIGLIISMLAFAIVNFVIGQITA